MSDRHERAAREALDPPWFVGLLSSLVAPVEAALEAAERRGAARMRKACADAVLACADLTDAQLIGGGMRTNGGKERTYAIVRRVSSIDIDSVLAEAEE